MLSLTPSNADLILIAIAKMLFAICIGFNLFVIIELTKRGKVNQLPVQIGVSLLSLWALRFSLFYLKFEPWVVNYPVLLVIDQYLFLLDGLLMWLYAKSVMRTFHFNLQILLHFLPFALFIGMALFLAVSKPDQVIVMFNDSVIKLLEGKPINESFVLIYLLIILSMSIFYFYKSRKEISGLNASLKTNFSNIQHLHIDWLLKIQQLWIFLFIIPFAIYSFNYVAPVLSMIIPGTVFILTLAFLSYYFAAHLLFQSYSTESISSKVREPERLEKTTEDQEELDKIFFRMHEKRYYVDEQLSLPQLASFLNKKPAELTKLIKKSKYNNFYDLINSFRIEAVKKELLHTNEQVIVIAYRCGFNSKSTFNKTFKEQTGITPKVYRNTHK